MSEQPRVLGWRLVAALAGLALVIFVVWSGLHAATERDNLAQQSKIVTQQNEIVTAQNSVLIAEIVARQHAADQRAAEDSKERAILLARADQSAADLRAVLQYLRAHGIAVPTRFVLIPQVVTPPKRSTVTSPRVTARGSTSPSKGKGHPKH